MSTLTDIQADIQADVQADVQADIQYDEPVAGVFDAVIGATMPAEDCVRRCLPYVQGRRVLDIGVGTGRVAIPLAEVVESVTGLDNSAAMLAELHRKDVPANLDTLVADVRHELPFADDSFGAAISTMGSMACVRDRAELTAAFRNIAAVVEPGGHLVTDYYSADTYRPLAQIGTVEVPNEHHPSTTVLRATIEDGLLTVATTVRPHDGSEPTSFTETVLLLEPDEIAELAAGEGLRLVHQELTGGLSAFDWYVFERVTDR